MRVKIASGVYKNILDKTKGKLIRKMPPPQEVHVTPVEEEDMIKVYIEAGESIQSGDLLSLFDDKVYKSDKDVEFRKRFIGVSTENGITGESIQVIIHGKYTLSTIMPNGTIYMGNNGAILTNPPTEGVAYKCGVIVNGNTLVIHDNNYIKL